MTANRRPVIAGNWKMYKTGDEAAATIQLLKPLITGIGDVDVVIAPPFTALSQAAQVVSGTPIALCAQNLHWESEGAFTGEVSAEMLVSAGCRYVIIGHSERRQYFGETDQTVSRKLRAALNAKLIPILCIGESEAQREGGETFSVLDKQVQNGLEGCVLKELRPLILAYEPVWAIGTGKTATSDQAQEVHAHLRQWFRDHFDAGFAEGLRILYGGSVKPSNIKELMKMPDIDGALVGGASLDAVSFSQLVRFNF